MTMAIAAAAVLLPSLRVHASQGSSITPQCQPWQRRAAVQDDRPAFTPSLTHPPTTPKPSPLFLYIHTTLPSSHCKLSHGLRHSNAIRGHEAVHCSSRRQPLLAPPPPAAAAPGLRRRHGAGVPAVERHVPDGPRRRRQRERGRGGERSGDVRVRGLADGQRQQQRPHVARQGQLPALRYRLRRRAHRPLLQRLHHGRRDSCASRPAPPAFAQRGLQRRRRPPRRELRLRRRRDPGQHRPELRRAHPVQRADQELPGDAGPDHRQAGARQAGRLAGAQHLLRRHGQQRLPEQLPDAQLQHQERVQRGAVLHAPGAAVHQAAQEPVQPGSPQVRDRRRGVDGVHPEHARAEPGQPVLAGRGRPHHPLQQQGEVHGEHPQRQPPPRQVHLRRHLRDDRRGPQEPMVLRVQRGGPRVLRDREEPGDDHVPAVPAAVPEPEHVRLLGRLPPDGAGERAPRQGGLLRRHRPRLPHEHPAARRAAALGLDAGVLISQRVRSRRICFCSSDIGSVRYDVYGADQSVSFVCGVSSLIWIMQEYVLLRVFALF